MYKDSDTSQLMEFTEEECDSGEFAVWNKIGGDLLLLAAPDHINHHSLIKGKESHGLLT